MSTVLRPCATPGCSALVRHGQCQQHQTTTDQQERARRGTTAARGYGSAWQRYSRAYLSNHPWCTGCGAPTLATLVDHIQPVRGARDPRFWQRTNHQGLCRWCHAAKTQRETRPSSRNVSGAPLP